MADRYLRGRTIVNTKLTRWEDSLDSPDLTDLTLYLDDGSEISFFVQEESRGAGYGIQIRRKRK